MQHTITELNLNVNSGTPIKRVFAKQFDRSSRILKIKLYDNKDPISLDGVYRICIRGTKPDSTQFLNTCYVDDGFIIAELTEQMLAAGGTVMTDIVLFESENDSPILSSETFYIDVFPAYFNDNQVISDSEYSAILEALANAPNKEKLWGGYSDYFESIDNPPAEAVEEFEGVDISTMTLREIYEKIEIINKIIIDASSSCIRDVQVNGESVVDGNGVAQVSVPTNYVTTDTEQTVAGNKTFTKGNHSVTILDDNGDVVGTTYRVEDGEHYIEAKLCVDLVDYDDETVLTNEPYLKISYNVLNPYAYDDDPEKYYKCVEKIKIPLSGDEITGTDRDFVNEFLTKYSGISAWDVIEDESNRFVTDNQMASWDSRYLKPRGGIPKSDLSSAVQTSLEKADTAIQTHQDISGKANIADIPTKTSELTNDSGFLTQHQSLDNYVNLNKYQILTGSKDWKINNKLRLSIDPKYNAYGAKAHFGVFKEDEESHFTQYEYGAISPDQHYRIKLPFKSGTFALLSDIYDTFDTIQQDKNYVHTQNTASNTWTIVHNLNKYPSAVVINSAGEEVVGDITYDSTNQITIRFKGAFKGIATLN